MIIQLRKIFLFLILIFNIIATSALANSNNEVRRQFNTLLISELDTDVWGPSVGVMVRNANEESNNKRLEKLITDLSKSGILKTTQFTTKVVDLSQLEMVWEKDIEFNNSNFEEIFKKSKFQSLLIIDYSTTISGFEVSLNLYSMSDDSVGSVIATVPSTMLIYDWKANEEVEILTASDSKVLNEKIDAVLNQQIIIENAQTFEQHFANYKLQEIKAQGLESLSSLIEAIKLKPYLVDLVQSATQLSRSYFGSDAENYLADALYPTINIELEKYSRLLLDPNFDIFDECNLDLLRLTDCTISVDTIKYPQLLNLFLKHQGRRFALSKKANGVEEVREYILLQASRRLIETYKDGSFSDNYFDKIKASTDINISLALDIEAELNTAGFVPVEIVNYILGTGSKWLLPEMELLDLGGRKQLHFVKSADTDGNKRSIKTKPLGFNDAIENRVVPFREKISLLNTYFPPSYMIGGVRDKIRLLDNTSLGPCEIAKQGRIGVSGSDPSSFASYFTSLDERQQLIDAVVKQEQESRTAGEQPSFNLKKAIDYWKNLPIFEDQAVNSINDLFVVDYPLQTGKYLPNNIAAEAWDGRSVREHAGVYFNASSDRLVWADFCILSMMRNVQRNNRDNFLKLKYLDDGTPVFDFKAIAGLFITDAVDVNKPIILYSQSLNADWARLDISSDGTMYDPNGLNLDTSQFLRGTSYNVLHSNKWLYAPGIIQSSIGINHITEVHYSDIYGNKKIVKIVNGRNNRSSLWAMGDHPNVIDKFEGDYFSSSLEIVSPKDDFIANLQHNLDMFAAMNIELALPNYIKNSTLATQSALKISDIKTVFSSLTVDNRIALQTDLKRLGLYEWETNGASWELTKSAFEQLFVYLDSYYPERKYIADYGFDESGISDQEFINFWRDLYGCGEDNLLKITSVCGN